MNSNPWKGVQIVVRGATGLLEVSFPVSCW